MRHDLPSGSLTLLFTDIEGSTRLLQRLGAAGYARAQGDHRDLLRAAFRAHGGVEVDTQGDAFFYVFPSAAGCLHAAVDGQRALATHAWEHGDPVKVRMGMLTGHPERTAEGYVGIPVNQAARIASAAHGGQVLVCSKTKQLLSGRLDNDVTLRDLGEHRLKDFAEPQRLFQAVVEELPSDFSPLHTAAERPGNLPNAPTPFIGRGRLVTAVRDMLLRGDVRTVTLVGPGGTGKSRLALRVAAELQQSHDDGAFFVALAPLTDAARVPAAIATALQLREVPGQALDETLMQFLQHKNLLLLLDNFEHVREAATFIAELLRRCQRLKLLTTTREPLRLSGEHVIPVPPLELPAIDVEPTLLESAGVEAVRLFVDRAQYAQWDFELTQDNLAHVIGICRRVDALPLGIELAAARLYQMDVGQLHDALDKRMSVLTDGAVDLFDHQRTLRSLIAWSYELLEPSLQSLWRRLSVFAAGCTSRAAREVCDLEDHGHIDEQLAALVSKSMIMPGLATGSGAENLARGARARRFTMLSTLREFADEALNECGETEQVTGRFHQWALCLAEEASPHLRGADSTRWFAVLAPEAANFRLAMDQVTAETATDPEIALRLGAALWFFWYSRGDLTEGREHLQRALSAGAPADPLLRARALLALATIARQQNLLEQAHAAGEQALALFRHAGDRPDIAAALSELGAIAERQEDHERAGRLLTEALQLLRAGNNPERLAVTLNLLGIVEQLRGDATAARSYYQESLAIGRALQDQDIVGTALINLGEIAQALGDTARARERFIEGLSVWSQMNQGLAIAYCLEMLAGIGAADGRSENAAVFFGAADRVRERLQVPVEAYNLDRYKRDAEQARAALGNAAFEAAWERGRTLPLDRVIALVEPQTR